MRRRAPAAARVLPYYWPQTRIRRRGLETHRNLRMRGFLKSSIWFLIISFLFCLGYVWLRVKVVETGYQIRHLEEVRTKMKEDNRALTLEAATLRSPQRLEGIAAQLGLKRPTEDQIIFLKK